MTIPNFCSCCGNATNLDPNLWEDGIGQNCSICGQEIIRFHPMATLERAVEIGEIVCEFYKFGFKGIYEIGCDQITIFADGNFGCRGCYEYESDFLYFP